MAFDEKGMPPAATGGERTVGNSRGENIPATTESGNGYSLVADRKAIREALIYFRGNGPYRLHAVGEGVPFESSGPLYDVDAAAGWAVSRNAEPSNVYLALADVDGRVGRTKAKDADVEAVGWVWADLDPAKNGLPVPKQRPALLAKLEGERPACLPAPSAILDSGGGYWGFWRLAEPLPPDEARKVLCGVADTLESDRTFDPSRIARLAGTVNWPKAEKRQRGQVPALTRLILASDATVDAAALPVGDPKASKDASAPVTVAPARDIDPASLPVSDKVRALIVQGCDPDDPARWADRSDLVFYVACELVRAGATDAAILGVLLAPDLGVSAHVRGQRPSERYARRQVERARAAVAEDAMASADDFDKVDGKIVANSQRNIRLAIRKLGVRVRHDLFAGRDRIEGLEGFGPSLDDPAADRLWLLIDEQFRFRPSRELFLTVLSDAARRDAYHPVRDYLDGLTWDGTPRLDGWLTTYAHAVDTPYTRAVGKLVLVAAVRRVRQPGAKFDEMLVLESPQGKDKSTALKVLATRDEWFTDDLPLNVESKRVIEALSGKWIAEAGELKGLRKGGPEHLKGFLSRTHDKARMAYDRLEREVPRQWIVVGTTNDARYLRDLTGNRRFWPVKVEGFDLEALRRDRDQLWAEAAHLEAQGASIRLDPSLWAVAEEEQDARRIEEPFYEALHEALGEDQPGKIRGAHVWDILNRAPGQRTQPDNERVGDAMRRLGFERKKLRFGDKTSWGYQRSEGTDDLWIPPVPPF